jgi:hypothetical protein
MAIVDGYMYPEVREAPTPHDSLIILVIGQHLQDFQHQLNILCAYCSILKRTDLFGIKVIIVAGTKPVNKEFIVKHDVDIIYDKEKKLSKKKLNGLYGIAEYESDIKYLRSQIEAYLFGNGIFISFSFPAFGMHAVGKYLRIPELSDNYIELASEYPTYSNQFRFLLNKLGSVAYAVDSIKFFVQKRNKTNRRGSDVRHNSLEINYHLNNFYFLIASSFDIVARLLNQVYSLKLSYSALGIEKNGLQNKLEQADVKVKNAISTEMIEWLEKIKEIRNAIAHEESLSNSKLVQEKPENEKLSQDDINAQIKDEHGVMLDHMADQFGKESAEWVRKTLEYKISLKNNYDVISEDAIVFKRNKGKDTAICNPIVSLDYDFEKFQEHLWGIVGKISFK